MLRAEQLALIQEANQQLLAIRQQEMEYYTETFASFGTQGSLLAGFTLGALTGLDMRDFDEGVGLPFWKKFFQILAAVAMGASIHCILTTTFANIYGPNLALRGPSGSMVRAVKGMIAEKSGIFLSFIVCLICFQFITLAATWVKMQTYASCIATIVLSTGATYWYKYCLRIYNRFKFIEPDIEWRNSNDGSSEAMSRATRTDEDEDSARTSKQPRETFQIDSSMVDKQTSDGMHNQKAISNSLRIGGSGGDSPSKKWFNRKDKDGVGLLSRQQSGGSGTGSSSSFVEPPKKLFQEGYLSKMGKSGVLSKGEWSRRYFVLRGSDMFYYKSREDFEKDPSLSIKNRPISISNYSVQQLSKTGKPPFEFILKTDSDEDDRRTWHFRCDLADEMAAWIEAFSAAVLM